MDRDQNNKNDINEFYSSYTNNTNKTKKKNNTKKTRSKGRKIITMILVVVLCFSLGVSASIFSIGYFLDVNDVNFKELINKNNTIEVEKEVIIREINNIVEVSDKNQTSSQISDVAKKVIPSVVGIRVSYPITSQRFFLNNTGVGGGEGSGIVHSSDGYILTNNHVIEDALIGSSNVLKEGAKIEVFVENDENIYDATIIGRSNHLDIALIKIDALGLINADIGNSDMVEVGETAIAIGNPGGIAYMNSVTAGIVSGINRELSDVTNDEMKLNLIQTDAAINPGNSGGPLVNINGEVIGINTIKIADIEFEGLGFAIPINSVMKLVDELIEKGYVGAGTANIGINIEPSYDEEYANENNLPIGALVSQVGAYSPADLAGIKVYDIITEFNGVAILDYEQLVSEKAKYKPNDLVTIRVYRTDDDSGEYIDLELTLGETRK